MSTSRLETDALDDHHFPTPGKMLLRVSGGGGVTIGGILLGAAQRVHVMTPSSTVRRIVNMTAVAVADARAQEAHAG